MRDRSSTAERPFGGGGESKSSGLTGPTHGPIMDAPGPTPFPLSPWVLRVPGGPLSPPSGAAFPTRRGVGR